jgi:hypothetical protein
VVSRLTSPEKGRSANRDEANVTGFPPGVPKIDSVGVSASEKVTVFAESLRMLRGAWRSRHAISVCE